jgi:capsular polysaccharide biosynthesis protein
MTIQEYLRILQRRGWMIIVAVLLAAAGAYGISSLQVDMYRATVYVSTVPARPDWGLGNTAKDLMRNFSANLQTSEIAELVINRAQLDMTPADFLSHINVVPESSDFAIQIEARARDPHVAQLMALTLADQFVEERTAYYAQQDLDNRIEVKIRSRVIGYDHYQPKPLVNAIAGGALGLLLGLGLVLLLTWVEADLLRTPAALERALGVPVLGAIPSSGNAREASQTIVSSSPMSAAKTAS